MDFQGAVRMDISELVRVTANHYLGHLIGNLLMLAHWEDIEVVGFPMLITMVTTTYVFDDCHSLLLEGCEPLMHRVGRKLG
jgi:hypothetical protein